MVEALSGDQARSCGCHRALGCSSRPLGDAWCDDDSIVVGTCDDSTCRYCLFNGSHVYLFVNTNHSDY